MFSWFSFRAPRRALPLRREKKTLLGAAPRPCGARTARPPTCAAVLTPGAWASLVSGVCSRHSSVREAHTPTADPPSRDGRFSPKVSLRRAVGPAVWRCGVGRVRAEPSGFGEARKLANPAVEAADKFLTILPGYADTVRPPPRRSWPRWAGHAEPPASPALALPPS